MNDPAGNQESPQVPLRERIARAIFVHADHCRCGSGVIDPACITAKEDAVLAEVQTEMGELRKQLAIRKRDCDIWADEEQTWEAERNDLQAENERLKQRLEELSRP